MQIYQEVGISIVVMVFSFFFFPFIVSYSRRRVSPIIVHNSLLFHRISNACGKVMRAE